MTKIMIAFACVAGLVLGGFSMIGTYNYAMAQGSEVSDGGVPDGGIALVSPAPAAPQVADPVTNPAGFASDALDAYRAAQYAFFVVLSLYGLSRGLLYVGDKYKVAMLRTYRTYIVFASSVLGGSILSIAALSTIDLRVVLGAIASAAVLELRGSGKMTALARAESLYNAYREHTGGKSAVTGADLPTWVALPEAVRSAWIATAKAA